MLNSVSEIEIIDQIINADGFFPNNPKWPFLIYKHAHDAKKPEDLEALFKKNGWVRSWVNGIYPFHHYHSNTHEVLGILSGNCRVQIGGERGPQFDIEGGDILILPAGTSHKNLDSTSDFVTVGAYPSNIEYNMCYGEDEREEGRAIENIIRVPLPKSDPVYGKEGPLFNYWAREIH